MAIKKVLYIKRVNFLLFACLFLLNKSHTEQSLAAGICLSFDDRYIEEWYQLIPLFKESQAVATFFITHPDSLSKEEVSKLRALESEGNEIGFHGNLHVFAETYIKQHSYSQYLRKEIDDGLEKMNLLGFDCKSFAYPYGSQYWFTDMLLLCKFKILRKVAVIDPNKPLKEANQIFHTRHRGAVLQSAGFDHQENLTKKELSEAIFRAKKNQEVLLLHAHKPVHHQKKGYVFNIDVLRHILKEAKKNKLHFYTISEL